jgi:Flp pilus assembly protein TadG
MRNLILGVARPLLRLVGRDERGALGVLVAMMLGAGVLTGMGALVLDTGQLYQERADLQDGADAGAFAVADSCASGTCGPTLSTLSTLYANENTKDGSAASTVCGSGTLGACPANTGALDCPLASSLPPNYTGYVDVHTSTQLSGGSTLLPPVFAKTLLGNSGFTGTKVLACAQVAWGGVPSSGIGIITAFTISACEWQQATTTGTVYAPDPPTAPSSTLDRQIRLRSGSGTGCTSYPAPDDAISKGGWIAETGGCTLNNIPGTTYGVLNSGSTSSPNCNTPLFNDAQNAKNAYNAHTAQNPIYVPVYTKVTGSGASAVYNLLGIAGFVVTGFNIPPGGGNNTYPDWLKSANSCSGSTWCVNGYFVRTMVRVSGAFGPANLGLYMTTLTG